MNYFKMNIKRFEEFVNENSDSMEIDFKQDFNYDDGNFNGNYTLNGEEGESDEEGYNAASKIATLLGIEVNDFLTWFDEKFDFSFCRASSFEVYGKNKDLESLDAHASELD